MAMKISRNGSGVEVVIIGCPFCDNEGVNNIRYYNSHWLIDPNRENDRYSFSIEFCPFCGGHLPCLDDWEVVNSKTARC